MLGLIITLESYCLHHGLGGILVFWYLLSSSSQRLDSLPEPEPDQTRPAGRVWPIFPTTILGPGLWSSFFIFILSLVYWPNLRSNLCHKQERYRPLLHGSSQCRGPWNTPFTCMGSSPVTRQPQRLPLLSDVTVFADKLFPCWSTLRMLVTNKL